jgi:hypothetical protein
MTLAFGLMTLCVIVHASGTTWALRRLRVDVDRSQRFWPATWICIRLAAWMIVCHIGEIAVWAAAYYLGAAMPDVSSALYFSVVTYTTTGYGDLVLPPDWRLVGGVEALTGILMCGWSTAFFFAVLSRVRAWEPRRNASPNGVL